MNTEPVLPENHPCKWHEGDTPIVQDPDLDLYMAPGCQECGAMYYTKDCAGCGLEFLDWSDRSFDDVMAGPYASASGDLYCARCGPRHDREAERAEDEENYDYDFEL